MIDNENQNLGSIPRQVIFPDDEHGHIEYENQLDSKLKCLLKKRSNVQKMFNNTQEYNFPKSDPIYIQQPMEVSTPPTMYSSSFMSNKTVFSSSSSSSACSTSSSPSINNSKSLQEYDDDNEPGRKSRGNRFFPDQVVDILNKWFYENQDYPYPDENMTNVLAREANISAKQVRKWFANKRVRSNKCYKQTFRSRLNSTPCSSLKTRRTKSEQELDESSDMESSTQNSSFTQNLSHSSSYQDLSFYENLIRNIQQHQHLNLIQNAIYNSNVIANLLQNQQQQQQQQTTTNCFKLKTHLSNCFMNDQMRSENDEQQQQQQTQAEYFNNYQIQLQLHQLIQPMKQQQEEQVKQEQTKKPKVNFSLVSDLI